MGCEAGTEAAGAIMKEKSALNGFRSADHSDEPLKTNSVSGEPSTEFVSHLQSSKVTRPNLLPFPFLSLLFPCLTHNPIFSFIQSTSRTVMGNVLVKLN